MRVEWNGVEYGLRVRRTEDRISVVICGENDQVERPLNIGGEYVVVDDESMPGMHLLGDYACFGALAALCMQRRDQTMRSFVPSDAHRFWWSQALRCVTEYMTDPERLNHVYRWGE